LTENFWDTVLLNSGLFAAVSSSVAESFSLFFPLTGVCMAAIANAGEDGVSV